MFSRTRENDGMHPKLSLVPSEPPRPGEAAPAAPTALTLAQRLEEANRQLVLTRSLLAEKQRECNELASALAQDAHSDALTGLFNRRKFNDLCAAEIARSLRYATPLALIMVDVDHFKSVNDEHGHLVGDRAGAAALAREALPHLQQNLGPAHPSTRQAADLGRI